MAAKGNAEKEPPNIVHQNAIHVETVRKEQRHQKLFTNYSVNPRSVVCLAGKPNVASNVGHEDEEVLEQLRQTQRTPKQKYAFPQTASQEIGWDAVGADVSVSQSAFHRPRQQTEITKFMDAYWGQMEQQKIAKDAK